MNQQIRMPIGNCGQWVLRVISFGAGLPILLCLLVSCQSADFSGFQSTQITIESRGLAIPATWVSPELQRDEAIPVVIMAHGHGGTQDEAGGFSQLAIELAQLGIASIRLDFAGCGASTESFANNNISTMLDDLRAARVYALAQSNISQQRVGLLGYSIGGRLAMLDATHYPYLAIALWAPVGDTGAQTMIDFVGGDKAWGQLKTTAQKTGVAQFTTPWGQVQQLGLQWFTDLEQSDPLRAISQFRGALLILQGTHDETVSREVAMAVSVQATSSTYVESIQIHGAGHGLGFYDDVPAYREKTLAATKRFLSRGLGHAGAIR